MLRTFALRAPARLGVRAMATNPCPPTPPGKFGTADLCDVYYPAPIDTVAEDCGVQILHSVFKSFGGRSRFSGPVSTVKCFESNPNVRVALQEPGNGRVLVVDAGGSQRCAVFGDKMAMLGVTNGWAGVVINGCVRDSEDIADMDLGIKALNAHPLKSSKRDPGQRDVPIIVAGALISPGDWLYSDSDGIIVSKTELKQD